MESMGECAFQTFEEWRLGYRLLAYSSASSANSHSNARVTTYPQSERGSQRRLGVLQVSRASTFSSVPRPLVSIQVLRRGPVWVAFRPLPP